MPSNSVLPPAQPEYILRGHQSQIHALAFYAGNSRLLSADADGYVMSWDMVTKRPVAGWKAHEKAVLGVAAWNSTTVVSHGRDSRLAVWLLDDAFEALLSQQTNPAQAEITAPKPMLMQELTVNTMNFCAFAWCAAPDDMVFSETDQNETRGDGHLSPMLLAIPNTLDSESIDLFYMPTARRKSTVRAPEAAKTGMAMALVISASSVLTIAAGYESGDVIVYQHNVMDDSWKAMYRARPHSQPILSLCAQPDFKSFISSSADGLIAKHPFADVTLLTKSNNTPTKLINTKHSGQQGLSMRDDGRLFSTAGWDARTRIYSTKTMKELAVLKHHKQGCYETAFADVQPLLDGEQANRNSGIDVETDAIENGDGVLVPELPTVMAKYAQKVAATHWLAVGSKDGNISLWDVF